MNDWNIQSRAHACEACGQPFADRQPYHTLLFDEQSEFRRRDICALCWRKEEIAGVREQAGFISHWQGVFASPPPPSEPILKETAESLLRKLIELNDPRYVPTGYILAVMLERKRVLKVKEQITRDDQRVFIYEQPKTGDLFTITDPKLKLDQLEQVQRDVAELLEHGLNPPPATNPTSATAIFGRDGVHAVRSRNGGHAARSRAGVPAVHQRAVSPHRTAQLTLPVAEYEVLQRRLGYTFKDVTLLRLALTHPSVAHEQGAPVQHNQRLEFLGDAVLQLVLTRELYRSFPRSVKDR